jgi:hypothetical protein
VRVVAAAHQGLKEDFRAILAMAPDVRSEGQKAVLITWALIDSPAFLFNH